MNVTDSGGYLPSSRYYGSTPREHVERDGTAIRYTPRRLLPRPDSLVEMGGHVVTSHDRVDLLGYAAYADAQAWWRVADANPATHPDELTAVPGRRLRITLPQALGQAAGGTAGGLGA